MTLGSDTEKLSPIYYPPRARWYSPFFYFGAAVRRVLHLERIHLPQGISFPEFILSLLVPGYALVVAGRRTLGWAFMGAYGFAMLVFAAALGFTIGNIGYGLAIAVHASSIIFLEGRWLKNSSFNLRLGLAVGTLLVLWLAIYAPAVDFVRRHWFMPLRVRGHVLVVRCAISPGRIQRGEGIVYSLGSAENGDAHEGGGAVRVQAGFGFGPVLALAGDRVEFYDEGYRVNGRERPSLPFMPHSGAFVVPQNQWFIWPEFGIDQHGNVAEANIQRTMMQLAVVSESQFVGRPCQRWFLRRQFSP